MKTVLILGARAPASLEWTRIFAKAGYRVILADSLRYPISQFSKYASRYIHLPAPKQTPQKWLLKLKQIIVEYSVELILPTCEEVFYLSSAVDQLPANCSIFTSPFSLLKRLHHKAAFAEITQGWDICTPETILLEDQASLSRFQQSSTGWVFKPVYSRFATQVLIRPDFDALRTISPSTDSPWVAQQFVDGKEYCSFSVIQQGKVVAHSCYHPKYRVGKGAGIYFEAIEHEAIQNFVKHFAAQTQYHGQVGFDFIEDTSNTSSKVHVLECNPRATSGIHLLHKQAHTLVAAMTKGRNDKQKIIPPFNDNSASNNAINTQVNGMLNLAMLFNAAHVKHFFTKAFWHDFGAAHDVIWQSKDALPYLAQPVATLEMLARAVKTKRSILAATTTDIEWDGTPIHFDS